MPSFESVRVPGGDGVTLTASCLGGDGPPVLALHATGFHGLCWWPLAAQLVSAHTVWALDLRAHGTSDRGPEGSCRDWGNFVEDARAAVAALSERSPGTWSAIGHSLGGAVALSLEGRHPGTFSAIACWEPVVIPPEGIGGGGPGPVPLADLARRRRPSFESLEAALENYRSKRPFSAFDPVALEMYVQHGLVVDDDGVAHLACDREDEAQTFEGSTTSGAWDLLPLVTARVAVLAGRLGADPVGTLAERIARRLPRGGARRFDHLDHFGPMTAPAEVGSAMAYAIGGADSDDSTPG